MKHIVLLLFAFPFLMLAQKHDNVWTIGDHAPSFPDSTRTINIVFDKNDPTINIVKRENRYSHITVSFSDSLGNLRYHSNGCKIYDGSNNVVPGSNNLWSPFGLYAGGCQYNSGLGNPLRFGFMLGQPGHGSNTFFFQRHIDLIQQLPYVVCVPFMMSIKINPDGSHLAQPKERIAPDYARFFSACKHANGRDWWLLTSSCNYSALKYFRYLLSPNGIQGPWEQEFDYPYEYDFCYGETNIFSPDGSKFFQFDYGRGMVLFDFDRCTGLLASPKLVVFPFCGPQQGPNPTSGAAAFSPNSRYLYLSYQLMDCINDMYQQYNGIKIIQYNLLSDGFPLMGDTVGVFEEPYEPSSPPNIPLYAQLGPNGKIYMNATASFFHTVEYPNRKGKSCRYRNGGLRLPVDTQYAMPYFPNYRLGPLDGSGCDTLGLNNRPLADWYWSVEDSLNLAGVTFTDNSFYEPATWHWDFAGLATSQDTSPVFTFPGPGVYRVCLTVCNQYACDTLCREVVIGTSEVSALDFQNIILVFPNPANETLQIQFPENAPTAGTKFQLFDSLGRKVLSEKLRGANQTIETGHLPPGMYFWQVGSGTGYRFGSGRVVVLH